MTWDRRTTASSAARRRIRRRGVVLATALAAGVVALGATPASAGSRSAPPPGFTAQPITGGQLVRGAKSDSGRAAQTDPHLLTLTSSKPVAVVVKLDYDALASYKGDVAGLPATSPQVTGQALDPRSANAARYTRYAEGIESRFTGALRVRVPQAREGQPLRIVYGGIPVQLPGDKVKQLVSMPGVAAVQPDKLEKVQTDSSPAFIGANPVYDQLGGAAGAGKGVIVGVLDTGAWPEHPSYADPGNLPAPPPTTDGSPRICNFGDNPLTPANDPFVCNHKLIGGAPFLTTYNAVVGHEVFPNSARDSNGHGTHTSTTAAGGPVANANPLGISRGPIHGIAPGASISMYKVCGLQGCFASDSARAVARAIVDRVDVINYSISGGTAPFSDPVELAFLDAYAAGIFVSTSGGNSGPGAGTVEHLSPWVSTVAASTQARAFSSTVTLSGGGATAAVTGSSITAGITTPTPVVRASAPPYSDNFCTTPAPPGTFTGKIVVCARGDDPDNPPPTPTGRVQKGFNVLQGGAAGMLLYNPVQSDTETDNHFLPAVHLEAPAGATLLAFLAAHPDTTATFTTGAPTTGQGDVVAGFSSRGPGTDWIKPDIAAPGVQILAGNTPVPDEVAGGPPGNFYQAIAGTSMASPHVAGAAALLEAVHPTWTPGQIRSALTSTGTTAMTKTDTVTPADPFDRGGGRVTVDKASGAGLTFDESAANFAAAGNPLTDIDLNLATIDAPTMPGSITTTRTAKNVSGQTLIYRVHTTAPTGARITVRPSIFVVAPNRTQKLRITISAPAVAPGQYFGEIDLDNVNAGGARDQHLTVAFNRKEGDLHLDQTCSPATIARRGTSTCQVTVQNNSLSPAHVDATSKAGFGLRVVSATGATVRRGQVKASADLTAAIPPKPSIAPGASPAGFLPLADFGVAPTPIGDEDIINFNTPPFLYDGVTYTSIGISSDGYAVPGGDNGNANPSPPAALPDPGLPNNTLAPFWTDLDGTGRDGIRIATLTDGVNSWIVVEWSENIFGTTSERHFQTWLGINGTQDISFAYDPAALPGAPPPGQPFIVGVENADGNAGGNIAGLPAGDLVVTSSPKVPGGSLSYSFQVQGVFRGAHQVTTSVTSPVVRGTTTDVDTVTVN